MNPYRRGELPLYARYALSNGQALSAFRKVISAALGRGRTVYPLALPALLSEPALPEIDFRVFSGLRKLTKASPDVPSSWEIPLAGRKIKISSPLKWDVSFGDPEDAYALHRFGWVLPCLMENGSSALAAFFARLVPDWIARVAPESHPLAWETYNTAERIVNWIYLWTFLRDAGEPMPSESLVKQSLHRQSVHVAKHLEYFGNGPEDRTNNHLLNDGRALYLAGAFLRLPDLRETGRKILLAEWSRSFTPNGFLREGSSHYHLLVLSRILEVLNAARNVDDESLVEELESFAGRLLSAARLFGDQPGAPFPLIGDASPDFTPDWLHDILFWNETAFAGGGWLGLWPQRKKLPVPEPGGNGFRDFLGDGWCRFDGNGYRAFWHVQPEGKIPNYSHAHHDTGAFELHLNDQALFVDGGRASYKPDAIGLYGRSARSHNACVVDGREPFVSDWLNGSRTLLGAYKKVVVESSIRDGGCLVVRHDGFARIPGVGTYERKFRPLERGVMIEDQLEGSGHHRVDTYFHFAPQAEVRLEKDAVHVRLPGREEKITLQCETGSAAEIRTFRGERRVDGAPLGWFSPRYGEIVPSCTVRFRQRSALPLKNRFIARWS